MSMYTEAYAKKLMTPPKAVERIADGGTVVYGFGVAEPPALLTAIADRARADGFTSLKVYTYLPQKHARETVLSPDLSDCIQAYSWFVGPQDRSLVKVGLNYFVPNYFHQVPRFCSDFMEIDTTVTTVSPMDRAGYFSFGTSNDFTSTAARHCKRLIVEVNENMPRVFGDSLVHISEVDAVVENHVPLVEVPTPAPKAGADEIGKSVAELIPDGATIQLGIGALPDTIARYLTNHKDLGIHSELFVEGMVELIERGVVTGRLKNLHPRKHVFSVAQGTKRLYDFLNDNPSMESYPSSYAVDPDIIARNDNMIAVNAILEIDLLGQCNAEYLAGAQYSGTGGQLDYVRGAFKSKGGKSIHVFYSTAKGDEITRVVPRFSEGTIVTSPRMDTHIVATEYGVINLKGKSTRERALDIISIAHPKYRDDLLRQAEDMHLI